MRNRLLMLGMLTAALVAGGCNASNGEYGPGEQVSSGDVLAKPSATDQTETATIAIDSAGAPPPDSVQRQK